MGNGVNKTMEIKAGMPVLYVLKNGTQKQQKFAPVFDANRNGVYEAQEAHLFNTMKLQTSRNENGAYIFAKAGYEISVPNPNYQSGQPDSQLGIEKYISGQKVKLYDTKEEVITNTNKGPKVESVWNGKKVDMNKIKYMDFLGEDKFGNKTYITEDLYGTNRDEILKINMYGNIAYSKEPLLVRESQDDGFIEYRNGITKHYGADNKLRGSYEVKIDKDGQQVRVFKDANNKLLYKEVLNASGEVEKYVDPQNTTYKLIKTGVYRAMLVKYNQDGEPKYIKRGIFNYSKCASAHDKFTDLEHSLGYKWSDEKSSNVGQ